MGAVLQHPAVLIAVAAVLILFATSLFGFWELRLPGGLTQAAAKSYTGYFGSLFMGLTLGVVAAPCIGPFVLGLLTWVASMGSPWLGFIVFFTLSIGLGLPLFVLAVFSGQLQAPAPLRRVDALGAQAHGLGAGRHGRLFPEADPAGTGGDPRAFGSLAWRPASIWHGSTGTGRPSVPSPGSRPVPGQSSLALAAFLIASWLMRGPGVGWTPYSEDVLMEEARPEEAGHHRFLCGLVRPVPGARRNHFSRRAVVQQAQKGLCHDQGRRHQGRQPGA